VVQPDGGVGPYNGNPAGGSGTQGGLVTGVVVTYSADSGSQIGLMPGPDGGVTIGAAANFTTNFVYMSNSGDGTVSRVVIPNAGVPFEQARYFSVVPIDNHAVEPRVGDKDIWQAASAGLGCPLVGNGDCLDQLNALGNNNGIHGSSHAICPAGRAGAINSPSRTVVDRSGNVWVALRTNSYQCAGGPNVQAGVTQIVNVGDNISQCTPRCVNRKNIVGTNVTFTEGVPIQTTSGVKTLSPPGIIAAGSAYAEQYPCLDAAGANSFGFPAGDPTGNVETDARNYDDCVTMSIPLGDPHPDPLADPDNLTVGTSYGRAAAMSPHCDPATLDCDVWLGMWNGTSMVHLGFSSPYAGGAPFDVIKVTNTGVYPYGATVDCAGIVWSGELGVGNLAAVTTVQLNDPAVNLNLPPDTLITPVGGILNSSSCGQYGISSDLKERIWLASWGSGAKACSFDASKLLADYAGYTAVPPYISAAQVLTDVQNAWHTYDLSGETSACSGAGRGINTDKYNNVYQAYDCGPATVVAFNPDTVGPGTCGVLTGPGAVGANAGACAAVPCHDPNMGGAACPNGVFWWSTEASAPGGDNSIGVDLDATGNVWVGNYSSASAVEFNGQTGAFLNRIPLGNNVYSYSDFSGYALRNITLSTGLYSQAFNGCGSSPEFTQWQTLAYDISTPVGTDAEIDVTPTNSLAPAALKAATPIVVCQSVVNGNCTGAPPAQVCTPCNNPGQPINLAPFNIPGSEYLVVDVILYPKVCAQNGGAIAEGKPSLFSLDVAEFCPGN